LTVIFMDWHRRTGRNCGKP